MVDYARTGGVRYEPVVRGSFPDQRKPVLNTAIRDLQWLVGFSKCSAQPLNKIF